MDLLGDLFHYVLVLPMTNVLVALAHLFNGNFGLAIIAFTIIMKVITWPLTSSQYKTTRIMQQIQPQLRELEKKYKGKDPKKFQEEMMKLYREHGFNPLGCFLPLLIQMPIWFALFQVLKITLGETPESFVGLSQDLYPIPYIHDAVPFEENFLFWDLGARDPLVLPILVAVSAYIQQKMITPAPAEGANRQQLQQQQTQQMMTLMFPLMFFFWSAQSPAGLPIYWFVTNVIGIITQYFYMGRRFDVKNLLQIFPSTPAPAPAARSQRPQAAKPEPKADSKRNPEPVVADDGPEVSDVISSGGSSERRRKRNAKRRGKR